LYYISDKFNCATGESRP